MKKRFFAVVSVVMLMFVLMGCGKDMSGSPYLGKWMATSAEMSGIEMSVEEILGGEFSFELMDNGKCKLVAAGEEENGKWDETEGGFIIEDELTMTVDGDSGVMDYEGVTLKFERQK